MTKTISATCRCGQVEFAVPGPNLATGTHLMCYCKDCRAFALHLGAEGHLHPRGGSEMYQTRPDRAEIVRGGDHLACLRLSPKGPLRWYAKCCNTPMANTLPGLTLPFITFLVNNMEEGAPVGPVRAIAFSKHALDGNGPVPKDRGMVALIGGLLGRAVAVTLSGRRKVSPFFGTNGRPIAEPHILTKDERDAATVLP